MSKPIPKTFLNMIPIPIILVKHDSTTLNHPVYFLNDAFLAIIGWTMADIPDKFCWWHKAYPDPKYQKVVERQWELEMETANEKNEKFILMTVNIRTKFQGTQRFKVYTEIDSQLLDGYYLVAFEPVSNTTKSH